MRYTVQTSKGAAKFLRSLTDKRLYLRLSEAIDALESDPHPPGSLKLQGTEALYRIRIGDYRVVY